MVGLKKARGHELHLQINWKSLEQTMHHEKTLSYVKPSIGVEVFVFLLTREYSEIRKPSFNKSISAAFRTSWLRQNFPISICIHLKINTLLPCLEGEPILYKVYKCKSKDNKMDTKTSWRLFPKSPSSLEEIRNWFGPSIPGEQDKTLNSSTCVLSSRRTP